MLLHGLIFFSDLYILGAILSKNTKPKSHQISDIKVKGVTARRTFYFEGSSCADFSFAVFKEALESGDEVIECDFRSHCFLELENNFYRFNVY